jgi:hypothetical protein
MPFAGPRSLVAGGFWAGRSVVIVAVVAPVQLIVPAGKDEFLAQASICAAKCCLPATVQMFEIQPHCA